MPPIKKEFCFTHHDGQDVYLFTLQNKLGTTAEISNYGAIIRALHVKLPGQEAVDVVLGLDKMEDYLSPGYLSAYPYLGAVIGRYGNRIGKGKFTLEGKEYHLVNNNGPDHLHGGLAGFDKKAWKYIEQANDQSSLLLEYTSVDGEEGYPGNLTVQIKFELNDENELSYSLHAVTDNSTIINLTHHSYFNFHNGAGQITDYKLRIEADAWLEQDSNFVTTGNLLPVADSSYDFRSLRTISEGWNAETGYDQSFVRSAIGINTAAAEVISDDAGLRMEIFTMEPVVHLYTARWLGPLTGKAGQPYGPYSGFCLETQIHPNAINIPSFPNTILQPGETYQSKTIYKFSTP